MRVSACQCCGESINAGTRGPVPIKCGPCLGRRRPGGPPLPKKVRPRKTPEERIRSDRFTFVPGRVETPCGHCWKTLWICRKQHARSPSHFCGRECRGLGSRYSVPHCFQCIRCGKQCSMHGNPRKKQKGLYCSRKCAGATRGDKAKTRKAMRRAIAALERLIFPSRRRLYRVKLLRISKERAKRKSGNLRTRCKRFGVPYDSRVSRLSVCGRDGWICSICGVKTIKEANREHPHPLEGTLDHIIPLSKRTKGNTWDNAQCACRSCNCQKKRDRIMCCQMRLF